MENITQRLSNYIIFSFIKDFVNDLCQVYDDEPLQSYKTFLETVNLLTETSEYVASFKKALTGKHKARYCSGVYVDIPKFLKLKDENEEIIISYLDRLNDLYNGDFEKCDEYAFFKLKTEKLLQNIDNNSTNVVSAIEEDKDKGVQNIVNLFKPFIDETRKDFKSNNINNEKLLKVIGITVYDKIDTLNIPQDDNQRIKYILDILVNNSFNVLMNEKKSLLAREIFQLQLIKDLQIYNVFSALQKHQQ